MTKITDGSHRLTAVAAILAMSDRKFEIRRQPEAPAPKPASTASAQRKAKRLAQRRARKITRQAGS